VAELIACLSEEGETDLAISAWDIRLHSWCGCNDDFCQSFYMAEPPTERTALVIAACLCSPGTET
jgi:hypothetical protein